MILNKCCIECTSQFGLIHCIRCTTNITNEVTPSQHIRAIQ